MPYSYDRSGSCTCDAFVLSGKVHTTYNENGNSNIFTNEAKLGDSQSLPENEHPQVLAMTGDNFYQFRQKSAHSLQDLIYRWVEYYVHTIKASPLYSLNARNALVSSFFLFSFLSSHSQFCFSPFTYLFLLFPYLFLLFPPYIPQLKRIPYECNKIVIGNRSILRVNTVKYLGVSIDDRLNWNS